MIGLKLGQQRRPAIPLRHIWGQLYKLIHFFSWNHDFREVCVEAEKQSLADPVLHMLLVFEGTMN
ncbi:hypothetical protein DD557_16840 [Thalassobacter stenotrophicus]|nr:hypothetical protein DD557_16840 [Thalassobacter stenotrophicus]